jgi:hypothetical protein
MMGAGMVADMSHIFPASLRSDCGRVRPSDSGYGKLNATGQWLEGLIAKLLIGKKVYNRADTRLRAALRNLSI